MRSLIAVTLFLASLAVPEEARADAEEQLPLPATEPAETKEPAREDVLDVGALAGIGFPHPLAVEAVVRVDRTLLLGAEYGLMPKTTIASVDARMWSAAADARWFPFRGAFFVGLRAGYQSVSAETTLSAANVGSYTESVEMGTWFVNPRVGFLWTWKPFALGIDVGAQLPLSTTVSRSSLLAAASPDTDASITKWTNTFGKTVLPTVDLLRVGVVF